MDHLVQYHVDKGHWVMNRLIERLYATKINEEIDILEKEAIYGGCVHDMQDWLRLINYKRNYGND